jgi:hypothetical protein
MADIRSATDGARTGGRALISGPGVSATEGEGALTERVQRQRGNGRLQGSESFDQDQTEGVRRGSKRVRASSSGSERVRVVRSKSNGGNQTGKDERLRVALTGGTWRVRHACAKRYPAVWATRSESDGGKLDQGKTDGCRRHRSSPRR